MCFFKRECFKSTLKRREDFLPPKLVLGDDCTGEELDSGRLWLEYWERSALVG